MPTLTTITSNWQVYIPQDIRKTAKLTKPYQVHIKVNKNKEIVIKPIKSKFLAAAGSLAGIKPTKKIDIDNIRDFIDYGQW